MENVEEVKLILKECIEEVWQKHSREWFVEPEVHYKDHLLLRSCAENQRVMAMNHEFVTEIRESAATIRKVSLKVAVAALVTAFISFIVYHMRTP